MSSLLLWPETVTTTAKISLGQINHYLRLHYGRWTDWLSLGLMVLTLALAVRSVERAIWINPQPALTMALIISLLASFFLFRSRLPLSATLAIAVIVGIGLIFWQVAAILPTPVQTVGLPQESAAAGSIYQLRRMVAIFRATGPSQSPVYLAMLMTGLTWLAAFLSSWFLLRRRNPWPAVLVSTTAILTNLYNLTELHYSYFYFFLAAALVFLGVHSWIKEPGLARVMISVRRRISFTVLVSVFVLTAILVTAAWLTPEVYADRARTVSAQVPWGKVAVAGGSGLATGTGTGEMVLRSTDQDQLAFSSSVDLSWDVLFNITSSKVLSYWRSRRYDVYQSWGWSKTDNRQTTTGALTYEVPIQKLLDVNYTVTSRVQTDVLLTVGNYVSSDVAVVIRSFGGPSDLAVGNIAVISAANMISNDESYKVKSLVTAATADDLFKAGRFFTADITERYLQLPSTLPERVKQLSRSLVKPTATEYEKVTAVVNYLAGLNYKVEGTIPPAGVDGVDYFLFTSKTGNCTDFASAAVVLLRTAGVPARLAAGYLAKDWTGNNVNIMTRDYHAWPEVYFPGYGWIEFEATPVSESAAGAALTGGQYLPLLDDESIVPDLATNTLDAAQRRGNVTLLGATIIAGLAVLGWLIRRLIWEAERPQAVYARLCWLGIILGLPPRRYQTAYEYGRGLAQAFPAQAQAIEDITTAYSRSRYSEQRWISVWQRYQLKLTWHSVAGPMLRRRLRLWRS